LTRLIFPLPLWERVEPNRKCGRHTRESGYPVIAGAHEVISGAAYWIIRFRG
jgi:hypothetical protein